jgi:hypothetical protein
MKILEWLKNKGEVWHYECENGHKWNSRQSPRGTYCYGVGGQTRCEECGCPRTTSIVYIDGKITSMGAIHIDFKKKKMKK